MRRLTYYFQDACTPIMEMITDLYTFIMFFLVGIVFLVSAGLIAVGYEFFWRWVVDARWYPLWVSSRLVHCNWLEFGWTVAPLSVLLVIALPSFGLIYAMEEKFDFPLTVKVVGHQWYWEYEFVISPLLAGDTFFYGCDSYLQSWDDLIEGDLRLLETDTVLTFPAEHNLRLLTTSVDVIHSWALPSAGIKMDAVPGRLNQVNTVFNRLGLFFGQCSELCGVNHGFMPIAVKVLHFNDYLEVLEMFHQQIQVSPYFFNLHR